MSLPAESHKPFRIALLGIYHESNTFSSQPTTIGDFKKGRWLKGNALLEEYADAYHELGGAIEVFTCNQVQIVPVFYAETTPGGTITENTYEQLADEMMKELGQALPVDACFVVPHGAAVAVNHPDMDGAWLSLLREKLGNAVPVVGTLDPHANISHRMVSSTQALFPYRSNPHVDQRETGRRAAEFLLSLLRRQIEPLPCLWQPSITISIEKQHTESEPCKSLYRFARELEGSKNILHVEIALGFPYADVQEMGTSILIISNNDPESAAAVQEQLNQYLLEHKEEFAGKKESLSDLLERVAKSQKPVLLLDMGDNVGGGTAGNSTYLLEALDPTVHRSLICIYAPGAVAECARQGTGRSFEISFGMNPETSETYTTTATVISLHEGKFTEDKPRHGGQMHYDMGRAAVIQTEKGNTVLLHSKRMPPFSLAQLTSCYINPSWFDVLVAKGVNAPIAAYAEVCPTILQAHTPGLTQADMKSLEYKNRRKPLYPFEDMPV